MTHLSHLMANAALWGALTAGHHGQLGGAILGVMLAMAYVAAGRDDGGSAA